MQYAMRIPKGVGLVNVVNIITVKKVRIIVAQKLNLRSVIVGTVN
jgi:hypothetical protein